MVPPATLLHCSQISEKRLTHCSEEEGPVSLPTLVTERTTPSCPFSWVGSPFWRCALHTVVAIVPAPSHFLSTAPVLQTAPPDTPAAYKPNRVPVTERPTDRIVSSVDVCSHEYGIQNTTKRMDVSKVEVKEKNYSTRATKECVKEKKDCE